MPFAVEFTPRAARLARKLPIDLQRRLRAKLEEVAADPASVVQRLTAVKAYKVRVGDYRLILDIDWDEEVVYVLWVGHRKAVY
jgi:mRNA interferase RelE/StbE